MPEVPYEYFVEGIKQLVALDAGWVPEQEGSSLYIRPFVFASNQERFGVHESDQYRFMIFTGPVGPYYAKPLKVKVEDKFMRATHGGTGFAKCGGNYGASFYPAKLAKEQGFDQVLWTDGTPDLNIEESGTMNVMFVIDGTVVTPPLSDTILDGVTRDSFLALAAELGYKTEERKISANELAAAANKGLLQEAFGVGTAAVAAPISLIHIKGTDYQVPAIGEDSFMMKAKNLLSAIRMGRAADTHGWNTVISAR
jgi:branched-chain amino acid aminotransferase